ncbi:HNH endonuclease [Paenibacillus odorifer]|uniref:HNH endonuclease n=1 Tax=Paenibacillus TaxID=44249 RepID=UPI0003E1F9DE|nr:MULTISPECIES: HNH endonuclease signature motif containing protein [Paenibacillus]ETT46284.1 HNH endonuclease [Paenibacillus sp. FSL H8-237]OME50210.1 HNH endonuclease [Paenibacillus odorifer]
MPAKIKRPCSYPRCPELIESGTYCTKHTKLREQQRGTSYQRGYDHKWKLARIRYLRHHPLCVHCEERGEDIAATVVDHIIPHKGDMRLFWDIKNWQPLCATCHGIKTAKEDGGFGN